MASTYSPILKLELIGNGDQAGTWGTTTNTNLGTLIEQAIAGTTSIDVTSGNVTLTDLNGISDQARCAAILVSGTPGVSRNIIAPALSKLYVISNGSNAAVVIKTSSSTGYTIPTGNTLLVYFNGTDFILAGQASATTNTANTLVLRDASGNFSAGTITASLTGNATNITGTLAIAQGGTGATATTGSGSNVLSTSPTLVTPVLGTPTSGNLLNCTFPTLNQNTTGTAANVTGVVAVANGGSGLTTLTAGYIPFGAGTSAYGSSANLFWDSANARLGIGTAFPSVTLDVSGSGQQAVRAITTDTSGSNVARFIARYAGGSGGVPSQIDIRAGDGYCYLVTDTNTPMLFGTNDTERMRIDTSGNVLVSTTSLPTGGGIGVGFEKDSSGTFISRRTNTISSNTAISFLNPNGFVGSISTSGSATSYLTSSDYRLKEDVAPMIGALDTVAQLKPVTYKWKTDGSDGQGFIAHELQEVVAGCVTGKKDAVDADGNPVYQGIDTSFLVATLTSALQELKAIVDTQAEQIKSLQGAK